MPLDPATQVAIDYGLASGGWRSVLTGERLKTLIGKTIRASFWDLSAAGSTVDITAQPSANERFIYVLSGQLTSSVGSNPRQVGARTVIVVRPSAEDVKLQSLNVAGTEVVVFERIDQ